MLKDKTAVVTGASRGIGRAIALKFAQAGANVAVVYAGNDVAANEVKAKAEGFGVICNIYKCNVADFAESEAVIGKIIEDFGGVDILLPENVNVQVNSNSVFGGVEDKEHTNKIENTVTVYVNGTSLFGGIDVK